MIALGGTGYARPVIGRLGTLHWGLRSAIAVLFGVLTGLGFEPYAWWPLTLVGVAGLSLTVHTAQRTVGAAGLGLSFGLGFMGLGIGWMQVIFVEAMVALVAAEALFFALLAVLIRVSFRTRWWPLLAAGSWTLVEYLFSRFPFDGFGWMRLGYAMIDTPTAGLLPFIGVAGVGFATALVGQALAWLAIDGSRRSALVAAGAIGAVTVSGWAGVAYQPAASADEVTVGYVQGGAPGGGVYGLGPARTITRNQVAETTRLMEQVARGSVPQPDFVVWPENSTDLDPFTDPATGQLVAQALEVAGRPILVGTITNGPGEDERQTTSLWWHPSEGVQARYDKRAIVPFGEWVPLRSLLLPLIPNLKYVGAQSVAGTEPGALPVRLDDGRNLTLGVLVCYDLAFDHIVYDTVIHGGEVLVVQSSNAMYQGTGQIEQQFAMTRARAAELRRDILVVTTSGVSGLIAADGSVSFSVPDFTSASGVVSLPLREGVTPAVHLAPVLELTLSALTAAVVAGLAVRSVRQRRTSGAKLSGTAE